MAGRAPGETERDGGGMLGAVEVFRGVSYGFTAIGFPRKWSCTLRLVTATSIHTSTLEGAREGAEVASGVDGALAVDADRTINDELEEDVEGRIAAACGALGKVGVGGAGAGVRAGTAGLANGALVTRAMGVGDDKPGALEELDEAFGELSRSTAAGALSGVEEEDEEASMRAFLCDEPPATGARIVDFLAIF